MNAVDVRMDEQTGFAAKLWEAQVDLPAGEHCDVGGPAQVREAIVSIDEAQMQRALRRRCVENLFRTLDITSSEPSDLVRRAGADLLKIDMHGAEGAAATDAGADDGPIAPMSVPRIIEELARIGRSEAEP